MMVCLPTIFVFIIKYKKREKMLRFRDFLGKQIYYQIFAVRLIHEQKYNENI